MTFEQIPIQNGDALKPGHTYYLYALEEDIYTGPTLLLAREDRFGNDKYYAKAEVYMHNQQSRRTRRVKEE